MVTGQVKSLGGSTYIPDIGYVWKSADPTCPAELYAGTTWAQIKDQAILAAGDTYTLGNSGGSTMATIATANLPAHTHSGSTSSAGAHTHTVYQECVKNTAQGDYGGYVLYETDATTSSSGAHIHTVTVGSTGEGKAFSIMMPYIVRYMWERIG